MAHTWSTSHPTLTIPETNNVKYRGEVWTVYKMKVVDGENTFFVEKRFNAFVSFNDILVQAFGSVFVPKFPKASFFENKFDPAVIARRRKDLEVYLNSLLSDERFLQSIYLREFLQPPPPKTENPLSQPRTFPPQQQVYYHQQPPMQQGYYQQQPVQGYYQQPPPQGYYQQPVVRQPGPPPPGYYQQPIQPPLPGSMHLQPLPQAHPNQTFSQPPPPNTNIPDRFIHGGHQISLNAILLEACNIFIYLSKLESELSMYQSLPTEKLALITKNTGELTNVSSLLAIESEILERIAASLQSITIDGVLYLTAYCSVIEQARKFAQDLLLELQNESIPDELKVSENPENGEQGDYPNFNQPDREILPQENLPAQLPPIEEERKNEHSDELASFVEAFSRLNVKVENLLIEATSNDDPRPIINALQADKAEAIVLLDKHAHQKDENFVTTSRKLRTLINEIDNTSKLLTARDVVVPKANNKLQIIQEKVYKYLPYLEKELSEDEYTKLREKLKLLNRELTNLKNEPPAPFIKSNGYPVGELEELQTILSDLLFKLDEKFKPEVSTAKQIAKDFQLKKAKEGHKALEDEMFGL